MTVHEVARFQHLPDDFLCLKRLDPGIVLASLQLIEYGPVELLKDQKDAIVLSKDLQQVNDMIMLQLLQYADLSQRCLAHLRSIN